MQQPKSKGTTVYVSCASKEIERAEAMIASLRQIGLGVVIALDWPKRFREERVKYGAGSDTAVPPEVMREIFDEEIQVAAACDVFALLHPEDPSHTVVAWGELAAARLGSEGRRPVILVSRGEERNSLHPFAASCASHIVDDDVAVLTWLAGYMAARRAA